MSTDEGATAASVVLEASVNAPRVTVDVILKIMEYISRNKATIVHGEQSIKQLKLQNVDLEEMEYKTNGKMEKKDLKALRRALNKWGVDFNIAKTGDHKYLVTFTARDFDQMIHAMEEVNTKAAEDLKKKRTKEVIKDAKEEFASRESQRDGPNLVHETPHRQEAQR